MITHEVVLKAAVPAGSRFRGFEDVVVRDLVLKTVVIRYKAALLRVFKRPGIPLHINGLENDIRACVTKREISGGTIS